MKNMKDIYTIVYNRPYNPNKTYPQNANRDVAFKTVNKENVQEAMDDIISKGYTIKHIFDGIGKVIKDFESKDALADKIKSAEALRNNSVSHDTEAPSRAEVR